MAGADSTFGCCSSYARSCALGKGCGHYDIIHAFKNCSVYQKLYVHPDEDFKKRWIKPPGSEYEPMTPKDFERKHGVSSFRAPVEQKSETDKVLEKLNGKFNEDDIAGLLKLLGI